MLARARGEQAKGNCTDFLATKADRQISDSINPIFNRIGVSADSEDLEVVSEEITPMVAHFPTAMPISAMEAMEEAKKEDVCYRLWQPTLQALIT